MAAHRMSALVAVPPVPRALPFAAADAFLTEEQLAPGFVPGGEEETGVAHVRDPRLTRIGPFRLARFSSAMREIRARW